MPIRKYEKNDKEKILSLISETLCPETAQNTRHFWEWRFQENPFLAEEGPNILVLEERDKVLGALLSFPLPLQIQNQVVTANCMTSFISHVESRGGGIGLGLQMSSLPEYFFGMPNDKSYPLWTKMGATVLCEMESLVKVVRMSSFLRGRNYSSLTSSIIGNLWQPVNKIMFCSKVKSNNKSLVIREVSEFDSSFDFLWEEFSQNISNAIVKNSEYLNWRYVKVPRDYTIFAIFEGEKNIGFLVVRMSSSSTQRKGYIVDMMMRAEDKEPFQLLLNRAITNLESRGAVSIHCELTSIPSFYKTLLKKQGFICRGSTIKVVGNPHFLNTINYNNLKQENWFLTKGDGELDLLPDN